MKKILITIFTCVTILLCVGLSYSYFNGKINGEDKELLISSRNVRILFSDSKEITNNEIKPGWNESKTFSVKNESNDNFNYNIVFENLVNTFVTEGFLQYKITSTSGYNMTGYLDIPKSSTPQDIILAYDIDIPKDITHEYTIEFVYHDSTTVDQSEDMGKELSGNLAIIEGTVNPNIKYTVSMSSEHGSITPESNETVKKGNLEFNVTSETGYDINSMSVSCSPVANTVIVDNKIKVNDIRQNHNCEVLFDKETYTVNIVVKNGKSDALNKVIEYNGEGKANITPDCGYTLVGAKVSGAGCSLNEETGELSISNVVSNGTCTVILPRDKYTVTLTGTGIETSDSPKTVEYEGSTDITFTLSEGYELGSNVINCDNGEPSISGNTLTVSNVTANTTCTLSPTLISYEVTLKVNGGTPETQTKSINHNGSNTYTIVNSTGYKLELDGSISCTGNASVTFNNGEVTISGVTTEQTCTINLKKETRTITITKTGKGTVSPSSITVNYGDDLTVSVTPSDGYKYQSNTCGIELVNGKLNFTNITEDKSCSVTFVKDTYTVRVTAGTGGSITTSMPQTVTSGGSLTVNFSTSSYYYYSNNTCGGRQSGNSIIIENITSDKNCSVSFYYNRPSYTVTVNVSGGTINGSTSASTSVLSGSSTSWTIIPDSGYTTQGATVSGGCSLSGDLVVNSGVVSENKDCHVFLNKTYTITMEETVTCTVAGRVTSSAAYSQSVTCKGEVTASPNQYTGCGYGFELYCGTSYAGKDLGSKYSSQEYQSALNLCVDSAELTFDMPNKNVFCSFR